MHVAKESKLAKFSFTGKATTVSRLGKTAYFSSFWFYIPLLFRFQITWYFMQLIYEKLPQDISDRHVLLLDPILGTGEPRN